MPDRRQRCGGRASRLQQSGCEDEDGCTGALASRAKQNDVNWQLNYVNVYKT